MGQTLSEPVVEKHTTEVVRGKKYWIGLSDMQGWRISMEDSHSVHLYLPPGSTPSSSTDIPTQPAGSTVTNDCIEEDGNALMGVFDGHGGAAVAKFTGTSLHTRLAALDAYKTGEYEAALKEAFLKTDEDLRADPSFFNDPSGCTAVVSLVAGNKIYCANSGDSRAVLGYKGEAKALSNDHKPTNRDETARITSAGGFVEFGRVNGNLALSRAIGDFEFKQNFSLSPEAQIVTADPEIMTHEFDGEEEFMVLACDGIWDCLSSQQVVDFVRRAVANGDQLGKICEDLMTKCLATDSETGGIGCDNMTVVIVALLGGRTPDEWKAWVKDRVARKHGYDTPESVPDVFGHAQASTVGGGGGFRVGGGGGLANIASILSASGITFKPAQDSDSDEEDDIMGDKAADVPDKLIDQKGVDQAKPVDVTAELAALPSEGKSGSVELIDEDGDSTMDSGDDSDVTTAAPVPAVGGTSESPIPPSFSSIGSPKVPTHPKLQDARAQKQLRSEPGGDEMSDAAKVEGLMDTSESPLRL